jgi:hypothetical protein
VALHVIFYSAEKRLSHCFLSFSRTSASERQQLQALVLSRFFTASLEDSDPPKAGTARGVIAPMNGRNDQSGNAVRSWTVADDPCKKSFSVLIRFVPMLRWVSPLIPLLFGLTAEHAPHRTALHLQR